MFVTPNFSPHPGTAFAKDYASLLEHYSSAFGVAFDRPSATYWPHTLVPEHFRLKLLDVFGFSADPIGSSEPALAELLEEVSPIAINLAVAGAASAYWPTMVMTQMMFPDRRDHELLEIAQQLRDGPLSLDLLGGSQVTKAIVNWGQKIARAPQHLTREDFEQICGVGLPIEYVVNLTQRASVQAHFAMCCSCGGVEDLASANVPLERLIGLKEFAAGAAENLTALPLGSGVENSARFELGQTSWVPNPYPLPDDAVYGPVLSELGWVPNLFKAVSQSPEYNQRHLYALKLLEQPLTSELKPRHHAMARFLTCLVLDSDYFLPTVKQQLARASNGNEASKLSEIRPPVSSWSDEDRMVLELSQKMVCSAHQITQEDVDSACVTMGWSDMGYVDFMNTVAVQDSLCRLANALGVVPDDRVLSFKPIQ